MSIQPKGNVWYVVIPYKDAAGKKKLKWYRSGPISEDKSGRKAEKYERQLLTDLERGDLVITEKQTVSLFLDKWLEQVKPTARIGTIKKYESHIKAIKARMGLVLLDKLTGMDIQQFITDGRNAGVSGTYLYDQFATLKRALDCAVKWDLLTKNPARNIDAPKKDKPKTEVLTPDQAESLLQVVSTTDIYLPILMGLLCGLRRGEICGLRWGDVNIKAKTALIRNSLDVHDGEYILGPVKTDASEDDIPVPDMVILQLRKERIKQKRKALEFGKSFDKNGYCWAWEDGRPHSPDYLYHKFHKVIEAYNKTIDNDNDLTEKQKEMKRLPLIRIHDLRHTHATLLLRAHVDTKVVSKKLRHTDFRFTAQRYQHVQNDILRETADVMDDFFNSSLENGLERKKASRT